MHRRPERIFVTYLALCCLALFVAFWRSRHPRSRSTPAVQPRVSREELLACAAIARRRVLEVQSWN